MKTLLSLVPAFILILASADALAQKNKKTEREHKDVAQDVVFDNIDQHDVIRANHPVLPAPRGASASG